MKIQSKMLVFSMLCAVIPLTGVVTAAYLGAHERLGTLIEEGLEVDAQREMDDSLKLIEDNVTNLQTWSQLAVMQDVSDSEHSHDLTKALYRLVLNYPAFREITIINEQGRVVTASDSQEVGRDLRDSPAFTAMQAGTMFRSPMAFEPDMQRNIITLAHPIIADDDSTRAVGMIIGMLDWDRHVETLATRKVYGEPQDQRRRYLMRDAGTGEILYASANTTVSAELLGALSLENGSQSLPLSTGDVAVATASSRVYGKDFAGPALAAAIGSALSERVPNWTISLVLDEAVVFEPLQQLSMDILTVLAVALMLISLFAARFARRTVKPIVDLLVGVKRLSAGDIASQLPTGRSDEIGKLARSFSDMRVTVVNNERELIKRNRIAEEAARLKGEFVANMSHEIRTPINGVLGMTELLLNTELNTKQSRYASTIMRSGQSLLGVINDVLDFSKIEAGKLELQDSAFDLREIVEDVVEMLAEQAHKKGVEVIAQLAPDSHLAYQGDPTRLRQILVNLIGNAIKFTSDGEVRLRISSAGQIGENETLQFEVVDTGIGIPEEAQSAIFDSFVQADGSTTRRFGGTGLGLAISARLVSLMGGTIGVESIPDVGSTFTFTARLTRLAENVEAAWASKDSLVGKRVLIVDDNTTNREILESHVEFWGAKQESAIDGYDALRTLEAACERGESFDLAILDMHMPGMDGLALAEAIKANEQIRSVRLCMLSSVCDQLDTNAYQALGIQSTLTKPVRQTELYHCLTALMTKDSSGTEKVAQRKQSLDVVIEGRVLLAEDHPVNQDMMCEMLRIMGLSVTAVDNGEQAVEVLLQEHFDLVLMDCQMPVMDGFEATVEIRRRQTELNTPMRTPIIALTANAMKGDRDRCLASGMDDYLTKPVDTRELQASLRRWLPEGASSDRTMDVSSETRPVAADPDKEPSIIDVSETLSNGRSAANDEPVLNEEVIRGVLAMCAQATPGFFSKIVDKYVDNSRADVVALRAAIDTNDDALVAAKVHRLKSSSANLGGLHLSALCERLEADARHGDATNYCVLTDEIETEHRRVLLALSKEVKKAA